MKRDCDKCACKHVCLIGVLVKELGLAATPFECAIYGKPEFAASSYEGWQ